MHKTFAIVCAIVLSACESASSPEILPELGIINLNGDTTEVLTPSASRVAGTDFTVIVRTFGNSCVSAAGIGVRYTADGVVLTPYDNGFSRNPAGYGCLDILHRPSHTANLRFAAPGVVRVEIEGRHDPSGERVVVRRTLTIAD